MAFECLNSVENPRGLDVKLMEYDEEHIGKIQFYDEESGKLGLVLEGTEELQLFYERDVKKCEIYDEITYCQDKMTEEQMKDIFDEADLEKHRKKNKPLFQATRNSEHLNRLHKIDMEQLLCGAPPPVEEEPLGQYVDIHNFRYKLLPGVVQTSSPRMNNVNNQEVHGGWTEKKVRERLWRSDGSYPTIVTPAKLYMIQDLDDLFTHSLNILHESENLGVSGEGRMMGQEADLGLLLICTEDEVFVYDVKMLGVDAFKNGLGSVLGDEKILKILHDIRFISRCLYHQFGVRINNFYDTMIADQVFCTQMVFGGFVPGFYRSLSMILRNYLGIEDYHIFYPRYRRDSYEKDMAVWYLRPISEYLLLGAARNCLYLPALYKIIRKGTLLPFHYSVNILKNCIKVQDTPDAAASASNIQDLPKRIPENLPDWIQDEGATKEYSIKDEFIFQNMSNPDPFCVFSKDSMHQSMRS